jgi:hypothetical protein
MLLTVRVSPLLTAEEGDGLAGLRGKHDRFAVERFAAVTGDTAYGDIKGRWVTDGQAAAVSGERQFFCRSVAIA